MQLPSNKVAATLTIVVLIVTGTIALSYVDFDRPIKNLESVDLIIERKTDEISQENWLDHLAYIKATQPEARYPLEGSEYKADSTTAQASVDLLSEYFILKQKGLLNEEDKEILTRGISEQIVQSIPDKKKYTMDDLKTTTSSNETVAIYGERMAQITINHLVMLDSFKKYQETFTYLSQVSNQYQKYVEELALVSVPTVAQDIHLELINYMLDTKVFFDSMISSTSDPLVSIAVAAQYQSKTVNEIQLYTTLAQYFKNNGIIFETESTINFWKYFE